jgi:hypothetical protein
MMSQHFSARAIDTAVAIRMAGPLDYEIGDTFHGKDLSSDLAPNAQKLLRLITVAAFGGGVDISAYTSPTNSNIHHAFHWVM